LKQSKYAIWKEVMKKLKEGGEGGVVITEDYVVFHRKVWDASQRQYQANLEAQKVVRPN
jgi:hypothetical protein